MLARRSPVRSTCAFQRIQFTPDLLPSDVHRRDRLRSTPDEFEFSPGPVFANIVLADEINRASPKTQSALLECMEERQVTIDGVDQRAPAPLYGAGDREPDRGRGYVPVARGATRSFH